MNSYYGCYRTRTFNQIFSYADDAFSIDKFVNDFKSSGLYKEATENTKATLTDDNINLIGFMLAGSYGNSHIVNSDEHQFKLLLFSILRNFGPAWEEKLDIQEKLRILTDSDIQEGAKTIHNHAYADANGDITTVSLDETPYINDQNTSNYKKSKIEGLMAKWDALSADVTTALISKFAKLFIKITEPDSILLYETEIEND